MNETLNQKIWDENNNLKPGIKESIESIVEQFKKDLKAPINIIDVRIVGSNASYNYNDNSDIDIHLVVNNETLPYDKEILKLLYNSARNRFNNSYDITIKGLPIELSIEDINSNVCSNGVYSVTNNQWVKVPTKEDIKVEDVTNTRSYYKLSEKINQLLENPSSPEIEAMINQLYMIRKNSILVDGEYGKGNLIFKAIRNEGLLDKLKQELYNILSKELTLEGITENIDSFENIDVLSALRDMEV